MKHRINILYFTTLLIGALALALQYEITHGTPLDTLAYNAPPRHVNNCMAHYIGFEYSPAHDIPCHRLWGIWTRETILSESDFISSL